MGLSTSQIAASFLKKLSKPRESEDSTLAAVKKKLRDQYGEKTYNSWFRGITLASSSAKLVVVSVPTLFIKEWILTYYVDDIIYLWGKESNASISLEIEVRGNEDGEMQEQISPPQQIDPIIDCGSPLDPKLSFDTFVVGKSNELAFSAAKRVAESAGPVEGSNPLFLYGGVGLGKTHLMHAIAWHVKEHMLNKTVAYLSAEKFMYQYITALRNKSIMDFKAKFRSVDVLMVDDVQFISGKNSTQEEFFHTFNALIDQQKQLVISADRSPCDLEGIEERIKSRLNWGLVADIHNTTFELRVGILQNKARQMKIKVQDDVIAFLAAKVTSNVRELEGALHKIVAHALLTGKNIDLDTVRCILKDLLQAKQRSWSIEIIQQKVADYFGIKVSDMISKRRVKDVVYARHVAMYMCKTLTSTSLPEIGRSFHGRDHSTVIHALKKIQSAIQDSEKTARDVEVLTKTMT